MELACDAKMENRHYDSEGRLHILRTPISKATVNPYYGREIPNAENLGLVPDRVYQMLRDPWELAKAAPSFARNQLMFEHTAVSAEDPKQDSIAGTVGSDVSFDAPYLVADLCVWDAEAIAGIETDTVRELSSSYRYRADMTPGVYEGQRYDGVMRDIQGNHVALVKHGRAGSDVMAADSELEKKMETKFNKQEAEEAAKKVAGDEDDAAEKDANVAAKGGDKKAKDKKKAKDAEEDDRKEEEEEEDNPQGQDKKAKDRKAKDAEEDDEDDEKAEDDFDGLVDKLEGKGYSKEYATKVAGKVAKEKGDDKAKDKKAKDSVKAEDKMKHAMDEFRAELRLAEDARRDVRPFVGDVLAYDSAEDIYTFALDEMRVDHQGVQGAPALRAIFNAAKGARTSSAQIAYDSAAVEEKFAGANRTIRVM